MRHAFFSHVRDFYHEVRNDPAERQPPHVKLTKVWKHLQKEGIAGTAVFDGLNMHVYSAAGEPLFGARVVVYPSKKDGKPTVKLAMSSPSLYVYSRRRGHPLRATEDWIPNMERAVAFAKQYACGRAFEKHINDAANSWRRANMSYRTDARSDCEDLTTKAVPIMVDELQRIKSTGAVLSKHVEEFLAQLEEAQDRAKLAEHHDVSAEHSLFVLEKPDSDVLEVVYQRPDVSDNPLKAHTERVECRADALVDDVLSKLTMLRLTEPNNFVPGVGMCLRVHPVRYFFVTRRTSGPFLKEAHPE